MVAPIRVLIADDHQYAREGIRKLLSLIDFVHVDSEATSAHEVIRLALANRPDVVLLDLAWYKDRSAGIAAIRQLKERVPNIKIIAMTAYTELIDLARRAGADLALDKDALGNEAFLADRIKDVYEAGSSDLLQDDLVDSLSERELEVLKLMAQGKKDKAIAADLQIAESTAKKHVSSVNRKLGAQNRAEAVAIGSKHGLLDRRKPDG